MLDGIDAVRYFLMQKYHWLPSVLNGMSNTDLVFAMSEEMAGWTLPEAAKT